MPPITKPKLEANLFRIALAGLIAGASSTFLCLFYKMVYSHYTGFSLDQFVNFFTITIGCMGGALLAATAYYLLSRVMSKPQMIYVFLVFLLMIASLLAPLSTTLPDQTTAPAEFTLLTLPMHVFTGLILTYLIPMIAGQPKKVYNH